MSFGDALLFFVPCLGAIVAGSVWLSGGLRELGKKFDIMPALLGLITALGADSPEIASAISALVSGEHEMGIGVVLGSNLFNLAALLGLSPFLARGIQLDRGSVVFNGLTSLLTTGIAALLILKVFGAVLSVVLLGATLVLYVLLVWLKAPRVKRLPLPHWLDAPLVKVVATIHEQADESGRAAASDPEARKAGHSGLTLTAIIAGALVLIVFGSMGLVKASIRIAEAWDISRGLAGALGIAALTGFPNAYTSARLARRGKGAAVVSETLNSNTLNIVFGIGLLALLLGIGHVKPTSLFELAWLGGLTLLTTGWAALKRGLSRWAGGLVIALYAAFVVVRLVMG